MATLRAFLSPGLDHSEDRTSKNNNLIH